MNRASAAVLNAEVRRVQARLMDEILKLQKLAHKKVKIIFASIVLLQC